VNHGKRAVREITMAKLYTTELSQKIAYDCMQIFGGFRVHHEYPIGACGAICALNTIGAGASEIMKEIMPKKRSCRRQLLATSCSLLFWPWLKILGYLVLIRVKKVILESSGADPSPSRLEHQSARVGVLGSGWHIVRDGA